MKPTPIFLVALVALMSGCSSLRPPAEDKAVWLEEQREARQVPAQQKDPTNLLYYLAYGLGNALVQ
jgi:hypothetical protein